MRAAASPGARPHRLSLERIAEAASLIDPVFLDTPQFECEPLSARLGCRLTVKVETLNPIRSFKGRGTSLFTARLDAASARKGLVTASAGNFGQGLAYACRSRGLPLVVYASETANPLKVERMQALGAEVRRAGRDFDAAKDAARAWAEGRGLPFVEDGREVAVTEGAGTIGRELLARGDAFDTLLVPLGNGALLAGVARWVKAAAPNTRVLGVCSAGAPSMALALAEGLERARQVGAPDTIADGIAVRVPVPEAVEDLAGLVDGVLRVEDAALLEAMRLVHRHAGLVVEPAGVAGLAALVASPDAFARQAVATVLCGGNLTPEQLAAWLGPSPTP